MKKLKQAILLAGGNSTRFWPLRDKALTPYIGKTFMEHLVAELSVYVEEIFIVANPRLLTRIQEASQAVSKAYSVPVHVVPQDEKLEGLGGAALTMDGKVKGEAVIANISDMFDLSQIQRLKEHAEKTKAFFVLSVQKTEHYFPGGYLQLEGEKLKGIIEKPTPGEEPSDMVKLVADYVSDIERFMEILKSVKKPGRDSYEVAINEIIAGKLPIEYVVYDGPWLALKHPWDVLSTMAYFLGTITAHTDKSATVGEHTIIEGPVWIGAGAKIGNYSKIVGPVYIGEGAIIGDYCMVRDSDIGAQALVGGYSEVTRSYIGKGTMLHRNYVGDSVLGDEVLMGAQAVTANFRFDTKDVVSQVKHEKVSSHKQKLGAMIGSGSKIGVQTTILPGVKIGEHSFVAPASVIEEDIPDNMFYKAGKAVTNRS